MTAKHTPGPWAHVTEPRPNGGPPWETIEADGNILAEAYGYEGTPVEQHANARLIAAAPDMLAALQEASDALDNYADVDDGDYGQSVPNWAMRLRSTIDEAIARAEGTL